LRAGEELLLGPKRPIPVGLDGAVHESAGLSLRPPAPPSSGGGGSARSSNPDDGGGTSGDDIAVDPVGGRERGEAPAVDEDIAEDEDGVKCLKCEKMFHDIFSYVSPKPTFSTIWFLLPLYECFFA